MKWYDLHGKWKWEKFVLRIGQFIIFDLHDGGSGLIVAKCKLSYENIMYKHLETKTEIVSVYLEFNIANEYGGGIIGGVARMHLDLSVNTFVRSKKSTEYWNQHRIEHWKTFPIAPISAGTIRKKFREIASDYDNQKVIHPCFYGFKVRWRGNIEDEARFLHPMFTGFRLTKKPLPKKLVATIEGSLQSGKVNPWRWDPLAASLGKCPVCDDGVAGCPRCFMLPPHKDGTPSTAKEFEFDPEREREKIRIEERKQIAILAQKNRRLENVHISKTTGKLEEASHTSETITSSQTKKSLYTNYDTEYPSTAEAAVTLHTNLTTFTALKCYRNQVQRICTLYVKVMPTGYIRRFLVDENDTVFHLYNMFNAHSNFCNAHSSMIVLPTIQGMFELHKELSFETDLLLGEIRGRDTMGDFGLKHRGATVVMLFFPNYKPNYISPLLTTFFEKNTTFTLPILKTYNSVEKLPENITVDIVQKNLKILIDVEYTLQQKDTKQDFILRGLNYHKSRDALIALKMKLHKERMKERQKEKTVEKLRLESQLKGLSGAERIAAKKALKARDLSKKRSVLNEDEKLKLDSMKLKTALEMKKNIAAGSSKSSAEKSLSNIKLQQQRPISGSTNTTSSSSYESESEWETTTDGGSIVSNVNDDDDDDNSTDTDDDTDEDESVSDSSSDSTSSDHSGNTNKMSTNEENDQEVEDIETQFLSEPREYIENIMHSARKFYVENDKSYIESNNIDTNTIQSTSSYGSSSYYNSECPPNSSRTSSSFDSSSTYDTLTSKSTSAYSSSSSLLSNSVYSRYSSSTTTGSYNDSGINTQETSDSLSSLHSSNYYSVGNSSDSSFKSPAYHKGSSLKSLYSGHLSIASSSIAPATSLYSGIPLSKATTVNSSTDGSISFRSSSSFSTESTGGGLYTYRSALDSDFTVTPRTVRSLASTSDGEEGYDWYSRTSSYSSRASSASNNSRSSYSSYSSSDYSQSSFATSENSFESDYFSSRPSSSSSSYSLSSRGTENSNETDYSGPARFSTPYYREQLPIKNTSHEIIYRKNISTNRLFYESDQRNTYNAIDVHNINEYSDVDVAEDRSEYLDSNTYYDSQSTTSTQQLSLEQESLKQKSYYSSTSLRSKFEIVKKYRDKQNISNGSETNLDKDNLPRFYSDGTTIPSELRENLAILPKIERLVKDSEKQYEKKKNELRNKNIIIKAIPTNKSELKRINRKNDFISKDQPSLIEDDDLSTIHSELSESTRYSTSYSSEYTNSNSISSYNEGSNSQFTNNSDSIGYYSSKSKFVEQHRNRLISDSTNFPSDTEDFDFLSISNSETNGDTSVSDV